MTLEAGGDGPPGEGPAGLDPRGDAGRGLRDGGSEPDDTRAASSDVAAAVTDLGMQEIAYRAALGTVARAVRPSLMDFLR